MNMQPSHLVFLAGTAIYLTVRAVFQRRGAADEKPIRRTSARDRVLIILVSASQVGLPLAFLFTPWLDWANYALPPATIFAGTPLMAGALWLFWRSHADLGNSWSVTLELNRNHRLVTQGIYRLVRHPMYASFLLLGLSQALLLGNWLAGWAAMAAVSLMYAVRIPQEEKMMLEFFGAEYRAYIERTGGIVPRLQSARDA